MSRWCLVVPIFCLSVACEPILECRENRDCAAGHACRGSVCVADGGSVDAGGPTITELGNESCADAGPLSSGVAFKGSTLGARDDHTFGGDAGCIATEKGAPDRAYRVQVAPNSRLDVALVPDPLDDDHTWDAVLNVALDTKTCTEAKVCLASADDPERLSYFNTTSTTQEVLLVVDGFGPTEAGTFTLTATVAPPVLGDDCAQPLVVDAGARLTAQALTNFRSDFDNALGCGPKSGADRSYQVRIPPGMQLTARATPTAALDVSLALAASRAACMGPGCTADVDGDTAGAEELLRYNNSGTSALDVVVIVDTDGTGTFDLALDVGPPPAGVIGDHCTGGPRLDGGTLTSQVFTGYLDDFDGVSSCGLSPGPDRSYRVQVPAGQRLAVTVTPTSTLNIGLALAPDLAACTADMCIPTVDNGVAGEAETLYWTNGGTSLRDAVLVVDAFGEAEGSYTLATSLAPPPTGGTCQTAVAIAASGTRTNQSTAGLEASYLFSDTTCRESSGRNAVYSVALAANQRLMVRVTSTTDSSINLIAGPATNCTQTVACLASIDDQPGGMVEELSYLNGATARTVFVVISEYLFAASAMTYAVEFQLTP